jgi:hypothetical protein
VIGIFVSKARGSDADHFRDGKYCGVPFWAEILLVVVAWFVLAVLVGLGLAAVIRRRERQRAQDPPPGHPAGAPTDREPEA